MLFIPVGWEDALGGLGRPQSRINEDIRECDHFLLMLWDRWGSPPDAKPGPYTAATQEEYQLALRCLEPHGTLRTMVILFKAVEAKQLADPGEQLLPVLEFKRRSNVKSGTFSKPSTPSMASVVCCGVTQASGCATIHNALLSRGFSRI